ncbi:PAAR domain-containing protein, partial [Vibrio cholerae]
MPGAARLGDIGSEHDCFPPTPIIAGSGDVFIDGKSAVRQGDALEPHGCPCPKTPHGDHPRAVSGG